MAAHDLIGRRVPPGEHEAAFGPLRLGEVIHAGKPGGANVYSVTSEAGDPVELVAKVLPAAAASAVMREIEIQRLASKLTLPGDPEARIAPGIVSVCEDGASVFMLMERITDAMSFADWFGEEAVQSLAHMRESGLGYVADWVCNILDALYDHGIVYHDRTPYNFLIGTHESRVWIIDFEHAEIARQGSPLPACLREYEWNEQFR